MSKILATLFVIFSRIMPLAKQDNLNDYNVYIKTSADALGWHTVFSSDFIDVANDNVCLVASFLNSGQIIRYKMIDGKSGQYSDDESNNVSIYKNGNTMQFVYKNQSQSYSILNSFERLYLKSPSQSSVKGRWVVVISTNAEFQFNVSRNNMIGYNDCVKIENNKKYALYWKIHDKKGYGILELITPHTGKRELFVITEFTDSVMRLERRADNNSDIYIFKKI